MEIRIIALGKIKEQYMKQGIREYIKRLQRFTKVEIIEIKEEALPSNPSPKEIEKALEWEGQEIEKHLAATDYNYILAIEGKQRSSTQWAKEFRKQQVNGYSRFNFIIGSSHGLSDGIKNKGSKISFSTMTFPHQLMRLILLEQIYRCFKINHNEEYHK